MQGENDEYSASRAACRKIIDAIDLPDQRQLSVMTVASEYIATGLHVALTLGHGFGLSPQQSMDALKVALAGYLAGLDAKNFDEMEMKR